MQELFCNKAMQSKLWLEGSSLRLFLQKQALRSIEPELGIFTGSEQGLIYDEGSLVGARSRLKQL